MVFKLRISGYGWWSIYGFLMVWRWYTIVVLQCCYSEFMMICYNVLLWWFGHMFVRGLGVTYFSGILIGL